MQVVDLQEDEDFQRLGVELLSIAPDPVDAWREAGKDMDIRNLDGVLTDAENKVATKYGVMTWAVGSEPGHTFVLVDESGTVAWLQDYGAMESGGIMYVLPHEVVRQVREHL
jgi:alkyl hydroperoxide reductase subunit AhpC